MVVFAILAVRINLAFGLWANVVRPAVGFN